MMTDWKLKTVAVFIMTTALAFSCESTAPSDAPSASMVYTNSVADLERFAQVDISSDVSDSDIVLKWSRDSTPQPIYRARFRTSEAQARDFCSGRNGFGGALIKAGGIEPGERVRFRVVGESVRPALGCKSIRPNYVQREVIVSFPEKDRDVAVIHLIAFRFPSR